MQKVNHQTSLCPKETRELKVHYKSLTEIPAEMDVNDENTGKESETDPIVDLNVTP